MCSVSRIVCMVLYDDVLLGIIESDPSNYTLYKITTAIQRNKIILEFCWNVESLDSQLKAIWIFNNYKKQWKV